jgi:hypothetical protein
MEKARGTLFVSIPTLYVLRFGTWQLSISLVAHEHTCVPCSHQIMCTTTTCIYA